MSDVNEELINESYQNKSSPLNLLLSQVIQQEALGRLLRNGGKIRCPKRYLFWQILSNWFSINEFTYRSTKKDMVKFANYGFKVRIRPLLEECLENARTLRQRFSYKSKRHTQMVCLFENGSLVPTWITFPLGEPLERTFGSWQQHSCPFPFCTRCGHALPPLDPQI